METVRERLIAQRARLRLTLQMLDTYLDQMRDMDGHTYIRERTATHKGLGTVGWRKLSNVDLPKLDHGCLTRPGEHAEATDTKYP